MKWNGIKSNNILVALQEIEIIAKNRKYDNIKKNVCSNKLYFYRNAI